MGSAAAYPHADLRTWVESTIGLSGWDHVLFGSEYPVIFWRNETY